MRILRLDLDSGEELDLHPYVTVLGGLDPGLQRRVADQIARIARGDVDGIGGLIETHDMLIDIQQDRISTLALPADADVLVNAEQLPGASLVVAPSAESSQQRVLQEKIAAAEQQLSTIISEIATVADRLHRETTELDEARRSLDEFAVTAHEAALRAADEAEALVRRRLEAGGAPAAPAESVAAPDPEEAERAATAEQLAEQRRRFSDLEALLDEERLGLLQLLEQLEAEHVELEALHAELEAGSGEDRDTIAEPEPEPEPGPLLPDLDDMSEVEAAIREVVAGPPDAPLVASLPAAALADQVAAHRQRQSEFERDLVERGIDPRALRERLELARRAEADAAEAARPRTVSPDDDREIERLHDIANEHVDRRDHRRHGKESTRLYDEATEQLEEILSRYGFPTYAAFIMGRTAPAIDIEARRHHDEVKALVASLELELDEMQRAIESDPHGRMLGAERDQLWAAARDLLGTVPDDVEGALRALRVPDSVPFDAPERLRSLLDRLGVDTADATGTGQLLELADQWHRDAQAAHDLARAPGDDPRSDSLAGDENDEDSGEPTLAARVADQESFVADLLTRSTRLDAELSQREAEFEQLADEIAATEAALVALDEARAGRRAADDAERDAARADEPDPAEQLEQQIQADPAVRIAREQAALTRNRLERHHLAVEQVDRLHASIGETRQRERSLVGQRDVLQAERDGLRNAIDRVTGSGSPLPPVEWTLTDEGVGPIEWYLLGRVASLRSVSSAGSVPLVLNDSFRGLPADQVSTLCAALARIGETVQVIYLGDEPAVTDWVMGQGLDRAAVVRPGQPAM